MSFGRILLYGALFWAVGIIITLVQAQTSISVAASTVIFYFTIVLLPAVFFGIFFKRTVEPVSWKDGLHVGIAWIVITTLLNAIVLLRWLNVAASTYFSWYLLLDYAALLGIGMLFGELMRRARSKHGPEGLV